MPGVTQSVTSSRTRRPQVGQETTWGTQVAASAALMGVTPFPTFTPLQKSMIFDEDRGSLQNAYVSAITEQGGAFTLAYQYMSYEDILYPLYNTIQAVTPSGGNPYTYTFVAPISTPNAITPFTIEDGAADLTGVVYLGCIGDKFVIKGNAGKQIQADWSGKFKSYTAYQPVNIVSSTNASPIVITTAGDPFATGQQVYIMGHATNTNANGTWTITRTGAGTYSLTGSTGNGVGGATGAITRTITPAVADRTVTPAIFAPHTLYADPTGSSIGTTQIANAVVSYELTYENGVNFIWTGDSLNPTQFAMSKAKVGLKLTLLWTAGVKTLVNSLEGGTRNLFKILHTSGSKSFEIDFAGVLSADIGRYKNEKEAVAVDLQLESVYDSGLGNSAKFIAINATSALP